MLDVTRKALDTLLKYEQQKSDKDGHNPIWLYSGAVALAKEAIKAEEEALDFAKLGPSVCHLANREQIAAMAMQALLSNSRREAWYMDAEKVAEASALHADALMAELKKEPQ